MSNRIMTNIKSIGLILMLLIGIVSCEKDFEDIGIDLVDNNKFSVGDSILEIIAYNINIEKSRVDNNDFTRQPLSLLGVSNDNNFGHLKATLISQLSLPVLGVNFGQNPLIDKVVLDIPYMVKDTIVIKEITDNNDTIYESVKTIDSIYGNKSIAYSMTVHELGTFLNVLDPLDPTKGQAYYSDKIYQLKDQIYSDSFIPNVNDTVLYVDRELVIIGEDGNGNPIHDVDTIKKENLIPSIKLELDNVFFQNRFLNNDGSSDFDNNDSFRKYFRGVYVDANGMDGSLMNLNTRGASVNIYYTNEVIRDEAADEDLNGNGIFGEDNVVVKTKQSAIFALSGVFSNNYIHDYTTGAIGNVIVNPDKINGEEKLYIQGAAGSEAILDLISDEALDEIRSKNWLINDAILTFYVDGIQEEVPQQLFLYNYDYNSNITDLTSPLFGPDVFGGKLEYKRELIPGSIPPRYENVPEKYVFRITKYFSQLVDQTNPKPITKLAIKNFVRTDIPNFAFLDTLVKPYNWIPKGVVLKGNLPLANNDKRIKLEIFYSKIN